MTIKYETLTLMEVLWIFRCPVAIIPFVYVTRTVKVCCVIRTVLITASSFSISWRSLVELWSERSDRLILEQTRCWRLASLCKFSADTTQSSRREMPPHRTPWTPHNGHLPPLANSNALVAGILPGCLSKTEALSRKFCTHASQCYDRKESWRGTLTYARNSRVVTTESPFFK